jgi:hypothetical protein
MASMSKRMVEEALEPSMSVGCMRDGDSTVVSPAAAAEKAGWDR